MKQLHKKLKIIQRLGKNICKTSASKFSTQYIWKIYTNKWQTIQDQKTNGFHKRRNLNGQWAHVCLIHLGQIFLALTVSMASGPAPDIAKVTNEVTVANFMQTQSCETQNHFSPPFPGTCLLIVRKQSTPLQPRGMWRLVFPGMSLWPLIVRSHTGQKFHQWNNSSPFFLPLQHYDLQIFMRNDPLHNVSEDSRARPRSQLSSPWVSAFSLSTSLSWPFLSASMGYTTTNGIAHKLLQLLFSGGSKLRQ